MLVIDWTTFRHVGHLPRSSEGLARPLMEMRDVVIFISHRWWRPKEGEPDDKENTKFQLIVRGITKLIRQFRLDAESVVIWVDWACVDQDDPELQLKGINSLITFAARSHFVLTPIKPSEEAISAFFTASQCKDLYDYGKYTGCHDLPLPPVLPRFGKVTLRSMVVHRW